MPRPEPIRDDIGAQYATGLGRAIDKKSSSNLGVCSNDYATRKTELDKTNQYLKYDGQVLRFMCMEIPKTNVDGEPVPFDIESFEPNNRMRKYLLLFYLSDNKIEIRATKIAGEDAKVLLKKNKLPQNWRQVQRGAVPIYFEPTDFNCGGTIDIYGRVFMLISCDEFTKQISEDAEGRSLTKWFVGN